jgi:two-component system chemotaxis sensor kinase CheA
MHPQEHYWEKEIKIEDSSIEEFLLGFPDPGVPDLIINLDDDPDAVAGAYIIQKDADKGMTLKGKAHSHVTSSQDILHVPIEKMSQLSELVNRLSEYEADKNELTELVNEIQKQVTNIMKVPVEDIFHKMDRVVYDASRKLGKVVSFDVEGEEIEIDRNIVELVSESLIHIIRNAIDHGIEEKDERKAVGKKAKGSILLTVGVSGDEMFFTVSDDGRGLDIDRIYEVASTHGMAGNRSKDELSAKDIYKFITTPGFSTNYQVTEYSGRGVGLDIVAHDIAALGGRLEVDSKPGQWTEMSLFIPR